MFSSERIRSGLEMLGNGAIVVIAALLLWTQLIKPDRAVGDARDALDDVAMHASMLTKRMGIADRILLEFSDFQCPFCAEHALVELPRIRRELVDTGILSYGYLHFPLKAIHPEATVAGVAAECARGQDRFWEMHDRLFANRERLSRRELASQAEEMGLDQMLFEECMRGDVAMAAVEADFQQGLALGVRATPTFFIGTVDANGVVELTSRIRGQVTVETIKDALAMDDGGLAWWRAWLP